MTADVLALAADESCDVMLWSKMLSVREKDSLKVITIIFILV